MCSLGKRMLNSCRTGWRRKEKKASKFSIFLWPHMMLFVQVSLLSKENQNSPDRTCNLQQIALNLCVSDELSPPFITSVPRQCAAFQFRLSPMYLFISRFHHILRFDTSFWILSLTLAEGDLTSMKEITNKHPWHQFKKLLTNKGQATSEAAEHVSSCRYICAECTERFWCMKTPRLLPLRAFLHPCSAGW